MSGFTQVQFLLHLQWWNFFCIFSSQTFSNKEILIPIQIQALVRCESLIIWHKLKGLGLCSSDFLVKVFLYIYIIYFHEFPKCLHSVIEAISSIRTHKPLLYPHRPFKFVFNQSKFK